VLNPHRSVVQPSTALAGSSFTGELGQDCVILTPKEDSTHLCTTHVPVSAAVTTPEHTCHAQSRNPYSSSAKKGMQTDSEVLHSCFTDEEVWIKTSLFKSLKINRSFFDCSALVLLFSASSSATVRHTQCYWPGIHSSLFLPWPKIFASFNNPLYQVNARYLSLYQAKSQPLCQTVPQTLTLKKKKKVFFW